MIYRAAKVIFFLIFILVQLLSLFLVNSFVDKKEANPANFASAGKVIKEKFPEYRDISDEELGNKLFGKTLSFEQFKVLRNGGFTTEQIISLVEYKNKYNLIQKIGFYFLSLTAVTIIFYIIAKVLLYIIFGEKFLQLRLRQKN